MASNKSKTNQTSFSLSKNITHYPYLTEYNTVKEKDLFKVKNNMNYVLDNLYKEWIFLNSTYNNLDIEELKKRDKIIKAQKLYIKDLEELVDSV